MLENAADVNGKGQEAQTGLLRLGYRACPASRVKQALAKPEGGGAGTTV
jgi:hypothetical protein